MRNFLLGVFMLLSCAAAAIAGDATGDERKFPPPQGAFIKGAEFRALPFAARSLYASGFGDALLIASTLERASKAAELALLERCISDMASAQLVAILDDYLKDNPTLWQLPMNQLAFVALANACKKSHG
jgi:hypothetical protein